MKSRYFAFALMFLVASLLQASANACDHCKSKCSHCDNRGLLDIADSLFGKLHSQTKKVLSTGKPTSKSRNCDHAASCGCEVEPTCGCEVEPTCGCEVEPSCGCESQPSCGCESSSGYNPPRRLPQAPAAPTHQHQHMHYPPQQSLPPQVQAQPPIQSQPSPEQNFTPDPRNFTPAPPPPSLQRTPDADVDPFTDDSATRVRKIPARAIQHSQALPYGNSYDPQASSKAHFRLNDSETQPSRTEGRLATNSSSRTRAVPTGSNRVASQDKAVKKSVVVTASGTVLRPVPTSNARPLPSTAVPANPLRK